MAFLMAVAVAGGSWLILGFMLVGIVVISLEWWTRRGSAINHHPYHRVYGGQAGAWAPCRVGKDITSDVHNWTRGTR